MPGPAGNDLGNMEFFTIAAGISVHVFDTEEAGKPCLVLLHGYLETMYVFNELTEALRSSYRVIVIDMPGHGLTDSAPADEAGKRINSLSFCARVVAGLLDKCGVEKAWIAGHSMGGYVAQQFLSDFPERTDRMSDPRKKKQTGETLRMLFLVTPTFFPLKVSKLSGRISVLVGEIKAWKSSEPISSAE